MKKKFILSRNLSSKYTLLEPTKLNKLDLLKFLKKNNKYEFV